MKPRACARSALVTLLFGLGLVAGARTAAADPVADFYRGKLITWILSAGAGGGYSTYALAFAPYFSAHIPGNPRIVVQNMPGAGGIRAMMYLANVANKDGTTIGLVHSSVPFAPLYGIKGANFDPRQINWIGSMNASTGICVSWKSSGIVTWDDIRTKQYIVGGTGAGSQMETLPAMINKLFGTHIKIISGYKGGNDVYLAMERGEVNGRCGGLISSIKATRPDWFPQQKVVVPIQIALERDREFPDSPALAEFANDQKTKDVLRLILAPLDMDRPILAPPGTPPELVAALRKAFHETMQDKGFIAEAEKQHLELREIDGDKIAELLAATFALPADVVKEANEAMNLTGAGSGE